MESFNSRHEKKREHQSWELKGRFFGARVALDVAPQSISSSELRDEKDERKRIKTSGEISRTSFLEYPELFTSAPFRSQTFCNFEMGKEGDLGN